MNMSLFEHLEYVFLAVPLAIIFGIFLYGSLVSAKKRFPKYKNQLSVVTNISVVVLTASVSLVWAGFSEYVYSGLLRWLTLASMIWMLIVILIGFSVSLFIPYVNFFHYYRKVDNSEMNTSFSKTTSYLLLLILALVAAAIIYFIQFAQRAYI